ncbi:hypothetical protein ANN_11169 [Periplaneta americana]|uniref:Uncharacterized protein n=1 Tax=Periplaneta americana TaxID=6978 RepID=A0ABQ8T6J2_PERAM|nr:hypothetical protein ANN_11169 [Periplaneta americana]
MSPGSNTESYPAFAHIGLRENPGKNLNQSESIVISSSGKTNKKLMQKHARFSTSKDAIWHVRLLVYDVQLPQKKATMVTSQSKGQFSSQYYHCHVHQSLRNNILCKKMEQFRSDGCTSVTGVPQFCPTGVLLHASKSTDMSRDRIRNLGHRRSVLYRLCQPGRLIN